MTATERQGIISDVVQSVLQSLRTNSARIVDLTRVTSLPANSYIELSDGKRIKADDLANAIQTRILNEAVYPIISTLTPGEGGEYVFDGVTSGTFNEENNTIELKNAAGEVISTIDLSSLISEGGQSSVATASIELANKVFVPDGKKIILFGASFAGPNNGWDKILQDITGIEVINNAVGGTKINSYTVARLLNANQAQPHGSLFMVNNRDVFDDIGAVVIMYTHNNDVLLNEVDYKTRTVAWYKSNYINQNGSAVSIQTGEEIDFASAWDFVIKQLKEWCEERSTVQDTITVNNNTASRQNDLVNNQLQILILSHWLPSRSVYNESSRKLAKRHGVAYCPLDTELGFTKEDMIHATIQYDGNSGVPKEGDYNRSVIHSEFVNVSGTRPVGRTETIDNIIWGWHPQTISSSIDYGYGKIEARDGSKKYVPWIQLAIAAAVCRSVDSKTASDPVETGENKPEKNGDYSDYEITGNYFAAETHVVRPSDNYTMTGYIKVEMGDTIIFGGTNQPPLPNGEAIPYIMGYSDVTGNGPVVVLPGNEEEVKKREVRITGENIHYIRCCARIKGYNGAEWGMSVIIERADRAKDVDYSNYEITGNYFASGTYVVSPSDNYTMTDYIKVEVGDTIIFSGTNQPPLPNGEAIPYIMGYSDTEGSDPVVVLPGNNAEVKLLGVKITDGDIHYIRCCARKGGYNGAKWGMSVVKKRASGAVLSGTGANSLVLKSTESSAEGPNSIALGNKVQTKNKGEAAFGNFNASNKYTNEGDEPDTLFSIGNGSEGARRNAFEVKVNGDIYIWLNGSRIKLQNLLSIQQITEGNYGTQVFQPTGEEQDEFVNYDNYEPVGSFGDPDNEYEPVGTFTAEAEG